MPDSTPTTAPEARTHAEREAKVRATEAMLTRYIQQRKKKLAELALETLVDLEPRHPRRGEYEGWVGELDEELAIRRRLDEQLGEARATLHAGDVRAARSRLETLRKLAPGDDAVEALGREVEEAERGRAESADIETTRKRLEDLLREERLDAAAKELEHLASLDVPKLTLDFYRKRLEDARHRRKDRSLLTDLDKRFRMHLDNRNWEAARDVARLVGQRFPSHPRASEMIREVQQREAEQSRELSLRQGITALEGYLAEGRRREAELALKVLEGLELGRKQLAAYRKKVRRL